VADIAVTCVVSFRGFRILGLRRSISSIRKAILAGREYYRLVTPGFLHADMRHLLLNMFSLLFFWARSGTQLGAASFALIYFGAIVGATASLYVHRT